MLSFKNTYSLPFKFGIPNYTTNFLDSTSLISRFTKYSKREIFLYLKGQKKHEVFNISEHQSSILWINLSASSLGDSLMDLSSRALLKNKRIDLFTDEKNAKLYSDDLFFSSVYTNKDENIKSNYDLVIIDSYSTRSIRVKSKVAPSTPYVGMFGHYNGPEVNRVLFSFHQMNNLLGYPKSEIEINSSAACSMFISNVDKDFIKELSLPSQYITIALGGEWPYRTYDKWINVIEILVKKDKKLNVVLVGSDNATKLASEIMEIFSDCNLFNCVGKYTFSQTSQIILKAQLLMCCDGGLMHAANALNTPVLAMFAKLRPQMQLTKSNKVFPIFDDSDVRNIKFQDLLEIYYKSTKLDHTHHPIV